jgi:hypothetical protein
MAGKAGKAYHIFWIEHTIFHKAAGTHDRDHMR